ncbi:MAG: hypothetical protein KJN97_05960, partial [Deltaproteobacteria bacterium]|nr:hypothetical protein [Deltaproteobacteria bacterium]
MHRVRGFFEAVCDAVEDTTNLVERTHKNAARRSVRRFAPVEPFATPARAVNGVHEAIASGIYSTIRTISLGIRKAAVSSSDLIEASAPALRTPMSADAAGSLSWVVDHAQAGVSGFYGDWLRKKGSTLAPTMHLRHEGRPLDIDEQALRSAISDPSNKISVFVHGLSCTEWMWNIGAREYYGDPKMNFGSQLKSDCDYTPLYVRYNTGLRVAENGRALSDLLSHVLAAYPLDIEKIALIGHSMG